MINNKIAMEKAEAYKILKYEIFGENEEIAEGNAEMQSSSFLFISDSSAKGKYKSTKKIKKIKIAYKKPFFADRDGDIRYAEEGMFRRNKFDHCKNNITVKTESQFIIINDREGKEYDWLEPMENGCVLLHIKDYVD